MRKKEWNILQRGFDVFNYTFLIIIAVLMLYPFWYVLMFSISDPAKSALNNYYFLPQGFTLDTYKHMLKHELIYMGYKNSIFVTVTGTLLALVLTLITAYPLAIGNLKGKTFIFNMIFFTMLFSGGMIPGYLVVKMMGLIDSLWVLVILGSLSVFNLLIMVKFMRGIPMSLIESAKIDGYNDIAILIKIIVPLSGAMLSSIGLFYAVSSWNSFLGAVIYINSRDKMVLQVVIRSLFKTSTLADEASVEMAISTPEHFRMATIIITVLPLVMVYPFLQKYFVKGVQLGSVKG